MSVMHAVDESRREALREISLGGRRGDGPQEGPPLTVAPVTETQPPTVREARLADSDRPHEAWRQGTRWFVVRRVSGLRRAYSVF